MCRPTLPNTYTDSKFNTYTYDHTYSDTDTDAYTYSHTHSASNTNGYAYSDTNPNAYIYAMSGGRADYRLFYLCIFKHRDRCHRWRIRRAEWICHRMDDRGQLYR